MAQSGISFLMLSINYFFPNTINIFNFINRQETSIYKIKDSNEIAGVNTVTQLKELEKNINL